MNNSEMLYLYDAKLTNPNGDPDEENRPRMDAERDINLVTDVRLKRYIRDYILSHGKNIYVRQINDLAVTPDTVTKTDNVTTKEEALKEYSDVRMFGATMAIKGNTIVVTGPIQFNWGYSLNKVEIIEAGITSHFKSNEKATQSTMGRDYRVKYSFLAFSGAISGKRAEKTNLTEDDVKLLDKAMVHAITEQFTRSKIGQTPRIYIRIEYNDNETYNGDLREYINLKEKNELRGIEEVDLDVTKLKKFFEENKNTISKIYYYADKNVKLSTDKGIVNDILDVFVGIPSEIVK